MSRRPRHRSILTRVAGLVLAGLLPLAACSAPAPTTPSAEPSASPSGPRPGGTIRFGRAASTTAFDLHQQITANNAFAIDKVFEPLVSFDTEGALIPWLAEDWKVSDDQLTYTFTLREGLLFSDGSPVTAEDARLSLQRHLEVVGPLPLSAPIASITATDDRTLTIVLKTPYTPFLSELSGFSNGILPADFGGVADE